VSSQNSRLERERRLLRLLAPGTRELDVAQNVDAFRRRFPRPICRTLQDTLTRSLRRLFRRLLQCRVDRLLHQLGPLVRCSVRLWVECEVLPCVDATEFVAVDRDQVLDALDDVSWRGVAGSKTGVAEDAGDDLVRREDAVGVLDNTNVLVVGEEAAEARVELRAVDTVESEKTALAAS